MSEMYAMGFGARARSVVNGWSWFVLLGGLALVSACSSSGAAPTTTLPATVVVVPAPTGFVSEPTDPVGGGSTGALTYGEAGGADCSGVDPVKTSEAMWISSQLRLYGSNPAYGDDYLIVCVTKVDSASSARTTQEGIAQRYMGKTSGLFGSTIVPLAVPNVPGSTGITLGSGPTQVNQISFVKGSYVVFVVGASRQASSASAIQQYATSLATQEYAALPTG